MLARCETKSATGYHRYGGRGIKVCKRWKAFINFYKDMGPLPSKSHSIERIDNYRGYYPSNCKWALKEEQVNNLRHHRKFFYKGKSLTLPNIAKLEKINFQTLRWKVLRSKYPISVTEAVKWIVNPG